MRGAIVDLMVKIKKRVLHISKYYYPYSGGTEQMARDCVIALKGNYKQKVICFSEDKEDKITIVDDVEVIKCGCFAKISSQSLSTSYKKQMENIFYEFKPDIVIFHYPNPFVASILLNVLKKDKNNCKLVVYWHLDIIKQKILRVFLHPQNKLLLERANVVIATSPNYVIGSPWLSSVKEKCTVVPNCVNVGRLEITPEVEKRAAELRERYKDNIICLAVGRHTEYKGFTYLIQASKLLSNQFKIFITGTGELTDELHKEAEGDEKIQFLGRIDDTELKAYLLAEDIFCFPSITKNEAFGVALAEAMYYEKPAVTFTIEGSGVNYVSVNGKTGIEVENRNVEKFARVLEKLAIDSDLRTKLGRAAKKRVVENFLSTQYYENIRIVIDKL